MKEVTIDGVEYLPAATVAKEFRYTTDYIGQLCRAKKVDARLVGRTWYVNPLSLTKHKKARYKKAKPNEKTEQIAKKITLSRITVDPEPAAINATQDTDKTGPHFVSRINWKPIKYENDEADLLPKVSSKKEESTKVEINLVDAAEIKVKNSSTKTRLVSEDLPTVSLKGNLAVASLDDDFTEVETNREEPVPDIEREKPINKAEYRMSPLSHSEPEGGNTALKASLIPKRNRPKPQLRKQLVVEQVPSAGMEITLWSSVTVLTLCLGFLLFGELTLVAEPGSYSWGVDFSVNSLPALVSHFSK